MIMTRSAHVVCLSCALLACVVRPLSGEADSTSDSTDLATGESGATDESGESDESDESSDTADPDPWGCGLLPVCDEVPTLGPDSDDDPTCVWTMLRDAGAVQGKVSVKFATGWEGGRYDFYVDEAREVGASGVVIFDISRRTFTGHCVLRPAAFFQACLDDPDADFDCVVPDRWVENCVEAEPPCPP